MFFAGVAGHAVRLVDDHKVIVFVKDVRCFFQEQCCFEIRLCKQQAQLIPGMYGFAERYRSLIQEDASALHEAGNGTA